ncbi:putative nonribosomal peptide synthase [Aspergillus floccosus]
MTYAELDKLSLAVSVDLQSRGVQPESIVPLCFEKSRWTPVAIMGVLRAGGAFVLLDPSHPVARLVEICSEVQAKVVLTSHALHELGGRVCSQAIRIPGSEAKLAGNINGLSSRVKPTNAAYVAFTSGSTGKPKGIVIEHQSFCANALAQNAMQNLNQKTRAFQFASYGFDSSILEMLMTLIAGGCVCIPSEDQRLNDLASAICDLRANWLELTPSVTRFIRPEQVPGVRSVLLVGEPMSQEHIRQWPGSVQLLNAYGPAECSVLTAVQRHARLDDPHNIGRSYSSHCWIVSPHDHNQLEPLGGVGELLVSGPIVARGYLNYPNQTTFIPAPSWARQFGVPKNERFYKTGDLAQYNVEDGTLRYLGRKDREIKIHGQRVDLQEIEYHCSRFPEGISAVADITQVVERSARKILMLFLAASDRESMAGYTESHIIPADRAMLATSAEVKRWLQDRVPPFMVPTKYIWVDRFPLTKTGKLDRRKLIALSRCAEDMLPQKPKETDTGLTPDLKAQEDILRCGFAKVLGYPEQDIGRHDSFYELGGDSLAAIELVAFVRTRGQQVTVADVVSFQNAHDIARCSVEAKETQNIPPFNLVSEPEKTLSLAAIQCQVDERMIEDIYPCTPQQEGLMYLSMKNPGAFQATYKFSLGLSASLNRMKAAWDQLWRAHPLLRTRIVLNEDGRMLQVVTKEKLACKDGSTLDDDRSMGLGRWLGQLDISPDPAGTTTFALTLHHVLFDAWSYMLLLEDLHRFYDGYAPLRRPAFTQVIKYTLNLDTEKCRCFWSQEFSGLQTRVFPSSFRTSLASRRWRVAHQKICLSTSPVGWKFANQIKLAWALVNSAQTDSDDVVYGLTVSGRNAPVPEIDRIAGPTFATFPLRTQLKPEATVEQMLAELQKHDVAIMPFEQTGLSRIAEASSDAAVACNFQNLLTIRLRSVHRSSATLVHLPDNENQDMKFATYPLSIIAQQQEEVLETTVVFDETLLSYRRVQTLLGHFDLLLQQVLRHPASSIRDLKRSLSSQWQTLAEINLQTNIEPKCIHEVIRSFSTTQPASEAVCAWDGSLTYRELITIGQRFAGHLQSLGSGPEVVVGICMERSKWFPVAIVGVMLSGAALVLLEPNFPPDRLSHILKDSGAKILIGSAALQDKVKDKPKETQRTSNLAETMTMMQVNLAMLTPSVVRTIAPELVPTLQTLILGGESPSASDLATWAPAVRLHQSYGPAECAMYSATTERLTCSSDLKNVGSSSNASYWIVNPENHDELQPVGAVGELLIEGPLVGRGYVNRQQETEAAFIQDPAWSKHIPFLKGSKLYKTGDLAILNADKSLVLVGRKDTQVKLNGQRIELHEIERCATTYQHGTAAIAELVTLQETECSSLVMFTYKPITVDTTIGGTRDQMFVPPAVANLSCLKDIRKYLNQHLPTYMVPSVILPLSWLPLTPGGKVDRKALRQAASVMERETLRIYANGSFTPKVQPVTEQERTMRKIFAAALSMDEELIGVNDSFFALGGDSISAMQILKLCRKKSIIVPMPVLLSHNSVSSLCSYFSIKLGQSLAPDVQKNDVRHDDAEVKGAVMHRKNFTQELEIVRSRLNLDNLHSVEAICRCSDSHNGVLERYSLDYTNTAIFQIVPTGTVSAMQVCNAWEELVRRHTALRTILMKDLQAPRRYLQVILKQGAAQVLVLPIGENAFADAVKLKPVQYWGLTPPHRLAVSQDLSGAVFIRLETGGALIDAFSVSVLLKELSLLLQGQSLPKICVTYSHYLALICHQSRQKILMYWVQVLHGARPLYLSRSPSKQALQATPSVPRPCSRKRRLSMAQLQRFNTFWRLRHVTITNLVQCAWAVTLAQYTNSRDVCFGTITSGRENSDLDIHETVGSFFNILPCRFLISLNVTVLEALHQSQEEFQRRCEHQNCSMPEMIRESKIAGLENDSPLFNTVVTVQNDVSAMSSGESHNRNELEIKLVHLEDATEYDFCIVIYPSASYVEIELRHWTSTASDEYASDILHRIICNLDLIVLNPTKALSEVTAMGLDSEAN